MREENKKNAEKVLRSFKIANWIAGTRWECL